VWPGLDCRAAFQSQAYLLSLWRNLQTGRRVFCGRDYGECSGDRSAYFDRYFACVVFTNLGDGPMLTILFAIGVSFPLAFYHHAWALWLGMDHLIEGLSRTPSRP
jgi:hypothetical protein